LHLPSEVARLRFIAIAGGECATLAWDSTMCGWQNTEFTEGTFTSFEGAAVCVAGEPDEGGGDDDGDQGEGEPDSSLTECDSLPCCRYVAQKPATGRVWVVNDDGTIGTDCDCNHIQACIDSASAGDTVCVNPGTYDTLITRLYGFDEDRQELHSRTTFCIDKDSIVVLGKAGAAYTIIGREAQDTAHACVIVADLADPPDGNRLEGVEVRGFTFRKGLARTFSSGEAYGTGGMLITHAATRTVVVTENVFEGNQGFHGGAMRINGAPQIINNIFRGNTFSRGMERPPPSGGAIFLASGWKRPRIEGNSFIENGRPPSDTVRGRGGAICLEGCGAEITKNLFYSNWGDVGGALFLSNPECDPTIDFNVFVRCNANTYGGAIATADNSSWMSVRIGNNTFFGNSADSLQGGAFYTRNPGLVLGFVRNVVMCSQGGGVVIGHEGVVIDSFGCNCFFANDGPAFTGISEEEATDTLLMDINPLLCTPNPCTLYALHASSACAPNQACEALIGGVGVCQACSDTVAACNSLIQAFVRASSSEITDAPIALRVSPNPFTSTIGIECGVPGSESWVYVTIHDVRGRLVQEFSGQVGGRGSWTWDGRDNRGKKVASGAYFLRAEALEASVVRKVILVH